MINNKLIDIVQAESNNIVRVFTSTSNGQPEGTAGAVGQIRAITTIVLCNVLPPNPVNEAENSCNVNIYVVPAPLTDTPPVLPGPNTQIVSNLPVPAGETIFFAEERLVLEPGDAIFVGTSTANAICVTVSSLQV
jgi:hypothetical protein